MKAGSTVLVLGSGGVGKTSVAAALGLAAAELGLESLVLTVDPSRRLKDTLGLKRLPARPRRIGSDRLRDAGLAPSLRLSAMMLDVRSTWDGMLESFVPDSSTRRRLAENRFYQGLAGEFAGAEALTALIRVRELRDSGRFEFEVVDTPPAAQSVDFLRAPQRLARVLESRTLRWLFGAGSAKPAIPFANRIRQLLLHELERFAGSQAFVAVTEFFALTQNALASVAERFRQADGLVHSADFRPVVVTTAERHRLDQTARLVEGLDGAGLRPAAVVVNRMLDEDTVGDHLYRGLAASSTIARLREACGSESGAKPGPQALIEMLEKRCRGWRREVQDVKRFARAIPEDVTLCTAPRLRTGVNSLGAVARLATFLLAPLPVELSRRAPVPFPDQTGVGL